MFYHSFIANHVVHTPPLTTSPLNFSVILAVLCHRKPLFNRLFPRKRLKHTSVERYTEELYNKSTECLRPLIYWAPTPVNDKESNQSPGRTPMSQPIRIWGWGYTKLPVTSPHPRDPGCRRLDGNWTPRILLPPVVAVVLLVLAIAAVLMAVSVPFHHVRPRRCRRLHCCLTLIRHLELREPASAPRYMGGFLLDEENLRYILGFVVFVAKGAVTRRGSFVGNRNKVDYNTQKSWGEAVLDWGPPLLPSPERSAAFWAKTGSKLAGLTLLEPADRVACWEL